MKQHDILHPLQRIIGESLAKYTPLPSMDELINRIVRIVHTRNGREGIVKIGLAEPVPVPVDLVQALDCVDGDEVRCQTHMWAVALVQVVDPEVAVTLEAVVKLDEGGDGCEEWAGDFGERVQELGVDDPDEWLEYCESVR
jgi:hypothetical protein